MGDNRHGTSSAILLEGIPNISECQQNNGETSNTSVYDIRLRDLLWVERLDDH
jgi:hypothetical protein